jgi:hypothetical protein
MLLEKTWMMARTTPAVVMIAVMSWFVASLAV